jgi:large subunit ribosomal protein L23
MDLTRIIMGPIVTEKAEILKASDTHRTYTLRVSPRATKVDVKNALKRFYDVDVSSVRIINTRPKTRAVGRGTMEKRHRMKKMLVTLAKDSKVLDLTAFTLR